MHLHEWTWSEKEQAWKCPCRETISLREFRAEYGQQGNLDVDPTPALNRLASIRKGGFRGTGLFGG